MATFADRLKQLRIDAGLTQAELSKKLGFSLGAVGNYEAGLRTARGDDLERIADFFNVELDYLTGRTDARPEFSLEEQWILSCYRRADVDTKSAIKMLLRKFDQEDTVASSAS